MEDDMVIEVAGSSNGEKTTTTSSLSSSEFDLENYINNYSGNTKINRLIFIAEHCKPLEAEAYQMAAKEVQKTPNYELYKTIVGKSHGILSLDSAWVDNMAKKNLAQLDKLDSDLNTAKANMVKDSIRLAQNELGEFYYKSGDYPNAMKSFVRTRDYCTTSKNILTMCFNIIKVGIENVNYSHVITYVTKAEQSPDLDNASRAKLNSCMGLANLHLSKYKPAAKKFIETPFEQANVFSDVLSQQDIAIYGGLCALATFDRSELKKKVIDDPTFKQFMELVPEVRELINDFYNSKYGSCLSYLDKLKPSLLLDVHLFEHVEVLYSKIRSKSLIQYFSPYVSVDLNVMATAFNTTVQSLEKEISKLIMDDSIQARIDSHNKRLYARKTDQRTSTFEKTIQVGNDFQNSTNNLLLRLEMLNNNITTTSGRNKNNNGMDFEKSQFLENFHPQHSHFFQSHGR
ncbi:hypothetical protein CYY_002155 [Polysphondylium violaceum]|uniref:PCI domain-containing protein n=1 Tax=Polysphondylium violaceum TaxID=133409 RepID=A0A8J4Q887_9MYCE|nr:hypothetical protein CYY_002155 [Polysphondylium violaceum]